MAAPTDNHTRIRDAIADTLRALSIGCAVEVVDAIEDIEGLTLPAVAVACVEPVQSREEMMTNLRKGRGYPCVVALLANGTTRGEKTNGPLSATQLRELIDNTFDMKRLAGVAEVGWCEVSESGKIFDDKPNLFQKLQTAKVVNAVGRFLRS